MIYNCFLKAMKEKESSQNMQNEATMFKKNCNTMRERKVGIKENYFPVVVLRGLQYKKEGL